MGVSKETKETIITTIDEVFRKMNSISWIERQKVMKDEAFKNTEKILYCYNVLKEHVADEQEYLDIAFHGKSKSIGINGTNDTERNYIPIERAHIGSSC
jgi:uncharacterized protein YdeI (YjbR/CyaY-like superfamily)